MSPLCKRVVFLFLVFLPFTAMAAEDDVLTAINEAVNQYNRGDFAGAASNLDYAAQLIRQKKSENLKVILPEPLGGWQAGEASAEAVGAAMLGGGITVRRDYTKGKAKISVEVVTDSPILQSVMMMLNNPMFASAGGGKLETIKGQRAIVNYDKAGKSGDLNMVVGNGFMVTVRGRNAELADMMAYAGAVDTAKLDAK